MLMLNVNRLLRHNIIFKTFLSKFTHSLFRNCKNQTLTSIVVKKMFFRVFPFGKNVNKNKYLKNGDKNKSDIYIRNVRLLKTYNFLKIHAV